MKKNVLGLFLAVAMILFCIPGCDTTTENANITAGSTIAVELALDAWAAKGDAAQAKLACALITTNAQASLDWLNGNPTPIGTDVVNLLNTTLTKGLDPIIAEAINGSSVKSLKRGIWMNGSTVQFKK
jgi:hypothetical protein